VDCTDDFVAAQRGDHALDLAPVAEVDDIADVPAPLRASGRLEAGIVAVALDEVSRVREREATVDEGRVHANTLNPHPVSRLPTNVVNEPFTMFRVVLRQTLWHGATMQVRRTRAGGCFLTLCILGGFVVGLAIGNPMKGVLIGTGVGVMLALFVWLVDRRRPG
jgi:hypothetical protein